MSYKKVKLDSGHMVEVDERGNIRWCGGISCAEKLGQLHNRIAKRRATNKYAHGVDDQPKEKKTNITKFFRRE